MAQWFGVGKESKIVLIMYAIIQVHAELEEAINAHNDINIDKSAINNLI